MTPSDGLITVAIWSLSLTEFVRHGGWLFGTRYDSTGSIDSKLETARFQSSPVYHRKSDFLVGPRKDTGNEPEDHPVECLA